MHVFGCASSQSANCYVERSRDICYRSLSIERSLDFARDDKEQALTPDLRFAVGCFALHVLLPAQFCLDKHVDIAIHDVLHVARFRSGTVVLHHLVGLKNVRANLISPRDLALLAVLPVDLGALFVLLNFVKLRGRGRQD